MTLDAFNSVAGTEQINNEVLKFVQKFKLEMEDDVQMRDLVCFEIFFIKII